MKGSEDLVYDTVTLADNAIVQLTFAKRVDLKCPHEKKNTHTHTHTQNPSAFLEIPRCFLCLLVFEEYCVYNLSFPMHSPLGEVRPQF